MGHCHRWYRGMHSGARGGGEGFSHPAVAVSDRAEWRMTHICILCANCRRSLDEMFPVNDATVQEVEFHFRFFLLHFIWKSGNTAVLDVHARTDAVHCRAGGALLLSLSGP